MCAQSLSLVPLFVAPWTVAPQAPLPMEFPRQEYWSGLSFPPLRDLPNPGIKPTLCLLHGQADSLPLSHLRSPPYINIKFCCCLVAKSCLTLLWPPWTIAHEAPLSMGFSQARILQWVVTPFSRESFRSRNQTCIPCITGEFFTTESIGTP